MISPLFPPEMLRNLSPETKFRIWYEIEALPVDAMADLGDPARKR